MDIISLPDIYEMYDDNKVLAHRKLNALVYKKVYAIKADSKVCSYIPKIS